MKMGVGRLVGDAIKCCLCFDCIFMIKLWNQDKSEMGTKELGVNKGHIFKHSFSEIMWEIDTCMVHGWPCGIVHLSRL